MSSFQLLWNLGNSKFVDYPFLVNMVHKLCEGMSISANVKYREGFFKNVGGGFSTVLTVKDLDRAFIGKSII